MIIFSQLKNDKKLTMRHLILLKKQKLIFLSTIMRHYLIHIFR